MKIWWLEDDVNEMRFLMNKNCRCGVVGWYGDENAVNEGWNEYFRWPESPAFETQLEKLN